MEQLQLPKKWPEKLKELAINGAEEVTSRSTVYAAIELLSKSDDPEHNQKEFTIRLDPATDILYCWRIK